jgi:hypothetical protein
MKQILVFAALVGIGVQAREVFLATPNFSATAAVAVFAGFYFSRRGTAILVPLLVMAISNLTLDSYDSLAEMLVVYSAFLFPALLSHHLRKGSIDNRRLSWIGFGACAVAPSVVFFVTTNFAVWAFNTVYAQTWPGLMQCYIQAIPFYRYTLAGDLLCTCAVFSAYFFARWCAAAVRTQSLVTER